MAKRPLAWGDTLFTGTQVTVAAQISPVNLLTQLTPSDRITVMRLVINLQLIPSNTAANGVGVQAVDLAIGVAAEEAFTAGAIPDPNNSGDVPARGWLWRDRRGVAFQNSSGVVEDWFYPTINVDIRTMRKVDRGILYLTAFNSSVQGATPYDVDIIGIVRALCAT